MSMLIGCAVLTACTTYDPARHYDAAALEQPATIIKKQKFATKVQPAADPKTNMAFIPIPHGGGFIAVLLSVTLTREAIIDVYEYTVQTADSGQVPVYNDFPFFEIGHCVTLFTSTKPTYPRISPAAKCP